jgi:monomeric isocitrate dehydrogenase
MLQCSYDSSTSGKMWNKDGKAQDTVDDLDTLMLEFYTATIDFL